MKYLLVVLLLFASAKPIQAQRSPYGRVTVEFTKEKKRSKPTVKIEISGTSPMADSSWQKYLEKNINASGDAGKKAKKGIYTVVVRYLITKDGNIAEVVCEKDPGYGMGADVVRVVQKGLPWHPFPQDGKEVRPYRRG